MKRSILIPFVIIAVGLTASVLPSVVHCQPPGVRRSDLQRNDLSAAGHEVIQAKVDIDPGVLAPKHSHPGEEIVYVLKGTLIYELEGKPPVTLKAGDVLFIPAGVVHSAKNIGKTVGSELATYIVQKGKPLLVYAKNE